MPCPLSLWPSRGREGQSRGLPPALRPLYGARSIDKASTLRCRGGSKIEGSVLQDRPYLRRSQPRVHTPHEGDDPGNVWGRLTRASS